MQAALAVHSRRITAREKAATVDGDEVDGHADTRGTSDVQVVVDQEKFFRS
jgi:hypothetical protein